MMLLDRSQGLPRLAVDFLLLTAMGVFMAAIGAYGTIELPLARRELYWFLCIVVGGSIGVAIDEVLARRTDWTWRRVLASSVLMTPLTTLVVIGVAAALSPNPAGWARYGLLLGQVFVVCVPVLAVRALVWRRPKTVVETRTVVEAPLPEAEAAFRRRLSARRRSARLVAVEAHDHYLRVHTDEGVELITLRFADALEELSRAHGYQTHRSWWVAADAIHSAHWKRGSGELRLKGDVVAPVSRTYAPALKAAGWS